jgi:MATE family multidrug resistance protein
MYKDFIKLTIPNILTNLTIPLVSIVDVMLMGHMEESYYIIAIGLSVAIFNLMYWSFGFLRMGTTGQVAQAFGVSDTARMQSILGKGIAIATFLGLVFIVFQDPILSLCKEVIDVSDSTLVLIDAYFEIRIYTAPASIILFVINGWLLGIQQPKRALVIALLINTVNIILSYSLVQYFNYGIRGVAIGTLVAQFAGLALGMYYVIREYSFQFFITLKSTLIRDSGWREFIQVNGDLFIRTLCLLFTMTFFKVNAAELEVNLGAGNLLLLEFISLSAYGIDGLAFAAESISGKYFGRANLGQLKKSIVVAFQIGIIIGLFGTLVYLVFGRQILELLTNQEQVIDAAMPYIGWVIIAPLIHSIAFIWDGIYIGCTASREMKWSLLISTVVVFLPSYYVFSSIMGNHGIWLSFTLFMVSRGLIQSVLVKRGIFSRL